MNVAPRPAAGASDRSLADDAAPSGADAQFPSACGCPTSGRRRCPARQDAELGGGGKRPGAQALGD